MLTRIEAHCYQCGEDMLVGPGEYMRNFLGKHGTQRICQDCEEANVNTKEHIDTSAAELARLLRTGPYTDERILLALKVSYNNGYAQAVREQMAKLQAQVSA